MLPGGRLTDTTDLGARRRAKKGTRGALAVACIIAAVVAFAATLNAGPPSDPGPHPATFLQGYIIGQFLAAVFFIGGIVQLVLYFAVTRKRAPERGKRHAMIVIAAAAVGAAPISILAWSAVSGGHADPQQLRTLDSDYSLAIYDANFAADSRLIELLGWENFFEAHLRQPSDLPDLRRRIAEARLVITQRDEAVRRIQSETLVEADDLPGSQRDKEEARASFEAGFAETRPLFDRKTQLEMAMLDSLGAQVDILQRAEGRWQVVNGQVLFERSSDMQAFNRIAADFEPLRLESEELQRQAEERNRQREEALLR